MDHHGDARRQQLRPGRVDQDVLAVGAMESERVERPGAFPVRQLGLGDGGAEVDVPQRRGFGGIGLAPAQEVEER